MSSRFADLDTWIWSCDFIEKINQMSPKNGPFYEMKENICYKWYLKVTKQFFDNILSITKANSLIFPFHYSKKERYIRCLSGSCWKKSVICSTFFFYNSDLSFFFSETPLSLAVCLKSKSSKMVISLVNGGAIVDFRNKLDGSTALHRTVAKSNIESLQTLLDLGKVFFFSNFELLPTSWNGFLNLCVVNQNK